MSNIQKIEHAKSLIGQLRPNFEEIAKIHGAVNFEREAAFALEVLKNNPYLADVAMGDQDSFKFAIINVAAIGLSLSPAQKLAYLVPRKKKVCLDISYRGLVQLAADVGAIKYAVAEVVCAADRFTVRGFGQEPTHERDPFAKDRGGIVGTYCVAKTHDGDFITTVMAISEINAIRDRSESYKAYKEKNVSTPWVTDTVEMIKKTVIRRAAKSWPMTDTRRRLDEAIEISAESDPMDFATIPKIEASETEKSAADHRRILGELGREESAYLSHLTRVCRREIKSLSDLTKNESSQSLLMLSAMLDKKNAGTKNENAV